MKKHISLFLLLVIIPCVHAREIKIKWRDVIEVKDLAKARETAESEKKLITIIVSSKKFDSDNQGAEQTVDVLKTTIKALKASSVIVRSSYEDVMGLKKGDEFNMAVAEGVEKAGNVQPMIIVLNSAEKKLVAVIPPGDIYKNGSKAFRDVKKTARALKKTARVLKNK